MTNIRFACCPQSDEFSFQPNCNLVRSASHLDSGSSSRILFLQIPRHELIAGWQQQMHCAEISNQSLGIMSLTEQFENCHCQVSMRLIVSPARSQRAYPPRIQPLRSPSVFDPSSDLSTDKTSPCNIPCSSVYRPQNISHLSAPSPWEG